MRPPRAHHVVLLLSCATPVFGVQWMVTGCERSADESATLDVHAASSLTEAFRELERELEEALPQSDVRLTFAGSQVLRLQIEQGAGADVYASANPHHMNELLAAGRVRHPIEFIRNELVLIVPLDNPATIHSLADLPRARRLVIGTRNVPVGAYARELFRHANRQLGEGFEARVLSRVVSEESNARLVRAKVELGEADAALVYRTDAVSSDRVRMVPIPAELNVAATYSIGIIEDTDSRALAQRWIELVSSELGRDVLTRYGFSQEP